MTEKSELKIESCESVALGLTIHIALKEQMGNSNNGDSYRKGFLDLYAECLNASMGRRNFSPK